MSLRHKTRAPSVDHLLQLADQLPDQQIERLIFLLEALLEARQAIPLLEEQQEEDPGESHNRKARIELKMIPDSRGSGVVYGPYRYLIPICNPTDNPQ